MILQSTGKTSNVLHHHRIIAVCNNLVSYVIPGWFACLTIARLQRHVLACITSNAVKMSRDQENAAQNGKRREHYPLLSACGPENSA